MQRSAALRADVADGPLAPPRRRILLMANPTAGGFRAKVLEAVAAGLEAAGAEVEVRLTKRAGEIREVCADVTLAADTVVIGGGDGSLNEALRGLQTCPVRPKLAIIPFGTANVLAHELGLPFKAEKIIRMIAAGRSKPLYYGLANGVPFVLMASMGFDADVVHHVPLDLKRRFGKLAYVWSALKRSLKRRPGPLTVTVGSEAPRTCRLAVLTNSERYGGTFRLCPAAHATQPGLHLVMLTSDGPLALMRFGLALVMNRIAHAHGVITVPVETVTVTSEEPIACQIDGDPFGATPVTVTAAHDPARIIVA
ncbi:diacylglycerol/lipid kinase family protein [Rhodobium gokarnense]|uniref:YegS/Rv2252/BmrU family lipid kinase n=1 Tax=Rhodobium gokarnense TaxID=364296 RepID=A0ABT3HCS3_9HYPH|nr:YegS/Rv2252/BmrU family lipid kinase [Rhodobium gokarnense]MCW2308207.1 YegS/Rv2252/BmrU family lipid kinase [Rhodobium gokarnense]